jgi:hypothetical protein
MFKPKSDSKSKDPTTPAVDEDAKISDFLKTVNESLNKQKAAAANLVKE